MIIIKCRINEEHMFDLLKWDSVSFNANPSLELETSDLQYVKEVFDNLNKIEIYYNENLVATYTQYNAYSSIEFVASGYDENRGTFFSVLKIGLTQKSLIDKVDELDKTVNKVVDVDKMTASEYKEYITGIYGERGQKEIFDGTNIALGDGSTPLFTYNFEDQLNLITALQTIMLAETLDIMIPYHSHHKPCAMYSGADIVRIYIGLMVHSICVQTRVNMLNNWIRSLNDKEEMLEIQYDTELPQSYASQYETVISNSLQLVDSIQKRFFPDAVEEIDNGETNEGNSEE